MIGEICAQDIADVELRIDIWKKKLPFAAYDRDDLLGAALEHMAVCSKMGLEHWRAIFWGRLRWRLVDEMRIDPHRGARRAIKAARTISIGIMDFADEHDDFGDVDVADMIDRLPERDAHVVRSLLDGYNLREVGEMQHVTESALCLRRQRIARKMCAA